MFHGNQTLIWSDLVSTSHIIWSNFALTGGPLMLYFWCGCRASRWQHGGALCSENGEFDSTQFRQMVKCWFFFSASSAGWSHGFYRSPVIVSFSSLLHKCRINILQHEWLYAAIWRPMNVLQRVWLYEANGIRWIWYNMYGCMQQYGASIRAATRVAVNV
jgi:hypothetical protein